MSRNSTTELELVFDTDLSDAQLQAFLDDADVVVTNNLVGTFNGITLGTSELKAIEKYIAAHLASMRDPRELRHKTGDAEAWYYPSVTTAFGKQLNLTPYGQQALLFDRTGVLARLGLPRGTFRAAPREDSDAFTDNLTKS